MADSSNVSVVRRLYQARGNPEVIRQVLAREVRWEVVDGFVDRTNKGHFCATTSPARPLGSPQRPPLADTPRSGYAHARRVRRQPPLKRPGVRAGAAQRGSLGVDTRYRTE